MEKLITRKEAAKILGISIATLDAARRFISQSGKRDKPCYIVPVWSIVHKEPRRRRIRFDTRSPQRFCCHWISHISSIHSLRLMAESQSSGMESYP